MRRRFWLLLNVLIVFGLILPGVFVASPFAAPTSQARVAAPEVSPAEGGAPLPASKRAKTKHDRRQDRRKDAEQDRKNDRKQADQKKDRKKGSTRETNIQDASLQELIRLETSSLDRNMPQGSMQGEITVGNLDAPECSSLERIEQQQIDLCTHGPDEPPPGFSITEPAPLLSQKAADEQISAAAIACDGTDGVTGFRVRVLYVRAADKPDNFAASLPTIQSILAETDLIYRQNSSNTGGPVRSLRFWQNPATCLPAVTQVVVSATGDDTFNTTVAEVKAGGLNGASDLMIRTDRYYLMFVDSTTICGQGSIWPDDQLGIANKNNTGPAYSRVDRGCWGAATTAHEVMHNLGGVQNTAPNTSGGWHCIDEWDIMCYKDTPFFPTMRIDCPQTSDTLQLDCNNNDYFNTNPPAGSYLATRWNTANSKFLTSAAAPPPPPPPPPPPTVGPPAPTTYSYWSVDKDKKKHKKKKKKKRH